MIAASVAVHAGTAPVSYRAPAGSCVWTWVVAGGFAFESLRFVSVSWKTRPDARPGRRLVNESE
jgi:hypothetical protein